MARQELTDLRAEIQMLASMVDAPLTRAETNALLYYGEDRLREFAASFNLIAEMEGAFEVEDFDEDPYGVWEIEVEFDLDS